MLIGDKNDIKTIINTMIVRKISQYNEFATVIVM